MFSFPEPMSSSSVKEGDGPPSTVKVEGGNTCKTPVHTLATETEKEGRVPVLPFTGGQELT